MKIYKKTPPLIIRISIHQQDYAVRYINVCETTLDECLEELRQLIERQNISIFTKGNRISLYVRESIGSKNGKTKSLSFYGMNPKEVHDLIINYLKQKNDEQQDSGTQEEYHEVNN